MKINGKEYDIGPRANLRDANLRAADLWDANLQNADLRAADLWGANLQNAGLWGANLRDARYAISQILLARWGSVSDALCTQLMRLDAEALPNGSRRMTEWANGGECPLSHSRYDRVAVFAEKKEAWKPGRPWSLWRIWRTLAAEKNVKISEENE